MFYRAHCLVRFELMGADGRAQMVWAFLEEIALVVNGAHTPTASEWRRWIEAGGSRRPRGVFVYSFGGGPSSAQRTETVALMEKLRYVPTTVMVTSSVVARGAITAMSWFVPPAKRAKVFAPAEIEDAFAELGLPEAARRRIYERLTELADTVDRPPGTLPQRQPS
ncbi:MAG: hypothetical protein ABW133_08850 [Polyangiaceae bacterium]